MNKTLVTKKEEDIAARIVVATINLFCGVALMSMSACVLIAAIWNFDSLANVVDKRTIVYMIITSFISMCLYPYLFSKPARFIYSMTKKS